MSFHADDVALAIEMMNEEATADVQYSDQNAATAEIERITSETRVLVSNTMKLHGLTQFGDADDGDEAGAKKVIDAVRAFQRDPAAYADGLFGSMDKNAAANGPSATVVDSTVLEAPIAPITDLAQAVHASPIEQPVASVRFVPRPAQGLFPGITATYHNDLIPTAEWETPKPALPEPDPDFQFNGYNLSIMALAIEEGKNVIATGDPGCGKTEFFKQFGARIGLPVNKVPFDGNLTRAEIIGSFRQVATPTGSETPFVLGLIPRLIQQPGIIILDEIDQADPDISYMLHPVYEGDGLTIQEDGGTYIPRHPNCYIVATANTKGRGSDSGLTHARFEMSEATRDRFPYWLSFSFMEAAQEARTINAKTGLDLPYAEKLVTVANNIRTAYKAGSLSQTCSLRQMLDVVPVYRRFAALGNDKALAMGIDTVMIGRANQEDADGIREYVKSNLNVDLHLLER
jgi:cobaltochelatase CobS